MKTVGEILARERLKKKITLEQAEATTKIRQKYLKALEENNWQALPSLTYIKGFLKNYAQFLGITPEDILPVFRRQAQPDRAEKQKVVPQGLAQPLNEPFLRLTPPKIVSLVVLSLTFLFFFWLFGQSQFLLVAPKIVLEKPQEGEKVSGGKVLVLGKTDPSATLEINGQKVDLLDGNFSQEVAVSPGIVTISISATNKFGKRQEVKRTIRVESP